MILILSLYILIGIFFGLSFLLLAHTLVHVSPQAYVVVRGVAYFLVYLCLFVGYIVGGVLSFKAAGMLLGV